jgi:hypothetical protein
MSISGKTVLMGGMAALRGGHENIPRFDIGGWYKTWPRFALAMPPDKTVNGCKLVYKIERSQVVTGDGRDDE